jgi:hypothetical protein
MMDGQCGMEDKENPSSSSLGNFAPKSMSAMENLV